MEIEENLTGELSDCEGRIISDISESKRSNIIGKICKIKINEYKKISNDKFELIIEFISYFSVKFIFDSNYPISPPCIVYNSGKKINNIFDENGNALVETIKKENWNKGIWLSTLIFYIELLISSKAGDDQKSHVDTYKNDLITNKEKYKKRKWDDYINETYQYDKNVNINCIELDINLKKLKE